MTNKWYKELRENATVTKTSKNNIIHIKIVDNETKQVKYERWIVKYNLQILHTNLVFKTEKEALDYNEKCKEFIQKQRLQYAIDNNELVKEVLEYPENLLKVLDITPENTKTFYNVVLRQFESNFDKVSIILSEREKRVLNARFKEFKTLEKIGAELDVTRERVRQIELRAIKKLKNQKEQFLQDENIYQLVRQQEYENIVKQLTYEAALEVIKNYELAHKEQAETIKKEKYKDESIENLDLSVRSYNALMRANLTTIGKVKDAIDDGKLFRVRNLGRKSYNEIQSRVADYYKKRAGNYN